MNEIETQGAAIETAPSSVLIPAGVAPAETKNISVDPAIATAALAVHNVTNKPAVKGAARGIKKAAQVIRKNNPLHVAAGLAVGFAAAKYLFGG